MGMLASDVRRDGSLTAAWDGVTPATEPSNTCVTVNQPANGSTTFQLTGTWVGTITFEVSLDGTFVAVPATKLGASPAQATTATTTGIYVVHAPGTVYIRARCSAFTSGTITVIGIGSVTEFIPSAAGLSTAGGGSSGTLSNNNAAPSNNHTAVLAALANAAAPSWTEGNEVVLSVTLAGALRVDTELPAAAALSDATGNPTTVMVGAATMGWDTVNWERCTLINGSSDARGNVASVGLLQHGLGYDYNGTNWDRRRGNTSGSFSQGSVAHDAVDAGNPTKGGFRAIAHGANPTAVSAADRSDWLGNVAGVPFVIGGHPNVQTFAQNYTSAQTNAAVITVAAGNKIVVTGFMITAANSNTVDVSARLGFGTANTPAYGAAQLLGTHPGIAPGSGFGRGGGAGIIGAGADDEDLRITLSVPTGGSCDAMVSYYTVPV